MIETTQGYVYQVELQKSNEEDTDDSELTFLITTTKDASHEEELWHAIKTRITSISKYSAMLLEKFNNDFKRSVTIKSVKLLGETYFASEIPEEEILPFRSGKNGVVLSPAFEKALQLMIDRLERAPGESPIRQDQSDDPSRFEFDNVEEARQASRWLRAAFGKLKGDPQFYKKIELDSEVSFDRKREEPQAGDQLVDSNGRVSNLK